MYNETFAYNDKDVQKSCKDIMHYILINICKKTSKWNIVGENTEWDYQVRTRYKEVHFMHVKWIIDRVNFLSNKNFGLNVIPSVYLYFCDEAHFVPESFRINQNHELTYWMSGADVWCMNKVIRKWKLYGWFCVEFNLKLYDIKCWLNKKFRKE